MLREIKLRKVQRSAAPSPSPLPYREPSTNRRQSPRNQDAKGEVSVIIVVRSQQIGINTKDGVLELTLPRMTPARAMWKILAMAARSKIAEFPKS